MNDIIHKNEKKLMFIKIHNDKKRKYNENKLRNLSHIQKSGNCFRFTHKSTKKVS